MEPIGSYRDQILLMFPDTSSPLTALFEKLNESEYRRALDRIRKGSVSPEDVHLILTRPSPASGLGDE